MIILKKIMGKIWKLMLLIILFNNVIHKKSKSGFSFNNILKNNSTENKKKIFKKKFKIQGIRKIWMRYIMIIHTNVFLNI